MKKIPCPLFNHSQKNPKHAALTSQKYQLNYGQLNRLVEKARGNLQKAGIGANERAGVLAERSVETIILLYALWRNRSISVILNTYSPPATVSSQLKNSAVKKIFTDKKYAGIKIRGVQKIRLTQIVSLKEDAQAAQKTKPYFTENQKAVIIFTSGSSGQPKAVLLNYGNLFYSAKGTNAHIPLKTKDCWLLSLPLYHVGGLGIMFRSLLAGASMRVSTSNKNIKKDLAAGAVTHLSLVPTQLIQLLEDSATTNRLKKLKCLLLGGAGIARNLLNSALGLKLRLYAGYGCSETASQIAATARITLKSAYPLKAKIFPFAGVNISKKGEILVKGKVVFPGYIKEGRLASAKNRDGFFNTGDTGELLAGKHLIVTGRRDNLIISGGENIQPEEIEARLNMPEVQRACVVARKDRLFGARPVVFIQTKKGKTPSQKKIARQLGRQMEKYKIPDEWYYWPKELQKPQLKIARQELQTYYQKKKNKLKVLN